MIIANINVYLSFSVLICPYINLQIGINNYVFNNFIFAASNHSVQLIPYTLYTSFPSDLSAIFHEPLGTHHVGIDFLNIMIVLDFFFIKNIFYFMQIRYDKPVTAIILLYFHYVVFRF